MFRKELIQLGLSVGEAKVYACLLQQGDMSATEIAKETGLGRTNIYEYATSLKEKRLVGDYERKRKIYFRAENPQELDSLLQKQTAVARQNELLFTQLLPRLTQAFQNNCGMPSIRNLIGDSGYEKFCDEIYLKGSNQEIVIFLKNLDNYEPPHPRYRSKIQARELHTYLFACKGSDHAEFLKRDQREARTTKIFNLCSDIDVVIAENKVFLGNLAAKDFAVSVIESSAFANFFRNLLLKSVQ